MFLPTRPKPACSKRCQRKMEITIESLIKIILGVLVFVVVVLGVYYFFKNYVIDFFTGGTEPVKFLLSLF